MLSTYLQMPSES